MLDFTLKYVVKVTMIEYVNEIISSWDKACLDFGDGFEIFNNRKKIATPAPEDLFKVDESAVKLGSAKANVSTLLWQKRCMCLNGQGRTHPLQ